MENAAGALGELNIKNPITAIKTTTPTIIPI
jgi:hypothetical protein